jgi:hypothetical protein
MIADYTFKNNAISILYDGMEIVVEFDDDVSSHIDILVRSSEKEYDEALDIVHERITKHIQTLRGAFDGCQRNHTIGGHCAQRMCGASIIFQKSIASSNPC